MKTITVYACQHCWVQVRDDGTLRWSCDGNHPEYLAQTMSDRDDDQDQDQENHDGQYYCGLCGWVDQSLFPNCH